MKIANSELFCTRQVTQDGKFATSKDAMKDCWLEEQFCYLKNRLTYSNKNSKMIFLYVSFLKSEEISFILPAVPMKSIK